jgi:hypothetical protein
MSTQCVRLFGDATEVSGELGGRGGVTIGCAGRLAAAGVCTSIGRAAS